MQKNGNTREGWYSQLYKRQGSQGIPTLNYLHLAIKYGQTQTFEELLYDCIEDPTKRNEIEVRNNRDETPFLHACHMDRIEMVKIMLELSSSYGMFMDWSKKYRGWFKSVTVHTACIGKKLAASNLAFQAFERFIGT